MDRCYPLMHKELQELAEELSDSKPYSAESSVSCQPISGKETDRDCVLYENIAYWGSKVTHGLFSTIDNL